MIITDKDLGLEVKVKDNTKLYPTSDAKITNRVISGTYYIYDTIVKHNRVSLTDKESKVGKPCQMTGWVDCRYIEEINNKNE